MFKNKIENDFYPYKCESVAPSRKDKPVFGKFMSVFLNYIQGSFSPLKWLFLLCSLTN